MIKFPVKSAYCFMALMDVILADEDDLETVKYPASLHIFVFDDRSWGIMAKSVWLRIYYIYYVVKNTALYVDIRIVLTPSYHHPA